MIRVVRSAEGVQIDRTGKVAGRGAYLHDRRECWERGLNGVLARALKTTVNDDERAKLEDFMNTLLQDAESAGDGG
jgi:predicted RNA-binding protein YlxR (DUF448 family)